MSLHERLTAFLKTHNYLDVEKGAGVASRTVKGFYTGCTVPRSSTLDKIDAFLTSKGV